ncbi:DUF6615 family protein [Gordonia malaquae]|uniref:DUF6615 family protein n=1 Tax=Gordonia malaquae TaxID=410332 RepID=UPI003016081F
MATVPTARRQLEKIAQAIDEFGKDTWKEMSTDWLSFRGHSGSAVLNEEHLTTTLTRRIKAMGGVSQYVFRSKAMEAKTGADWEWWITRDGTNWRCARVQAKMAYPRTAALTARYPALKDTVGRSRRLQIDALLSSSAQGLDSHGHMSGNSATFVITPYYCFYNGWPTTPPGHDEYGVAAAAAVRGLQSELAAAASVRASAPTWNSWAIDYHDHDQVCSGRVAYDCRDCGDRLGYISKSHIAYWGASALHAELVKAQFAGAASEPEVEPFFKQSLPLSTILFTEYGLLPAPHATGDNDGARPDDRPRAGSAPEYVTQIQQLRTADALRPDLIQSLDGLGERSGLTAVAVVDLSDYR